MPEEYYLVLDGEYNPLFKSGSNELSLYDAHKQYEAIKGKLIPKEKKQKA